MKTVVIVGGGFGGLEAAKAISRSRDFRVVIVDRRNHHLFQPLLYQVATAGLSPADIAVPIRSLFSGQPNVEVLLENVIDIDRASNQIVTTSRRLAFDWLVLACGAKHSYFGRDDWEEYAPGLKTLEQATEIRRRILVAFENAEREESAERRKALLTFVVVGGGPTGVELAGAIAEISRSTLGRDFRNIDPARTRVILIEAGPRVLGGFTESLSKSATRDLEQMGVQVWTGTRVTGVDIEGVSLGGERVSSATVIWAAGVQPSSLSRKLNSPLDPQGRVIVEKDLSIPGSPGIFVIGDQASFSPEGAKPLPGLAPVAIQQGAHVARVIREATLGRPRPGFRYRDKGMMATLGRKRGIVEFHGLKITGFTAWVMWLFVHIFYLIGFKNRLFVLGQWAWSYLTFKRGARLIVGKEWRSTKS